MTYRLVRAILLPFYYETVRPIMFTEEFEGIGPNGTTGLGMLTNGGKTNAPHHLQYTGMIPHKNALLPSRRRASCL